MATLQMQQQPGSKKPRLSLQIKTSCSQSPAPKAARGFAVNPSDPTAFNTLSNVYVTAIERSTSEPITAINTLQSFTITTPIDYKDFKQRVVTPYVAAYPETPLTAHSGSPQRMDFHYPSTMTMTATPPLSAGPPECDNSKVFTFATADTSARPSLQSLSSPVECRTPRRRAASHNILSCADGQPPYTHPRSLHSILRNSPLPPRTAIPPPSPRRQSLRLQEKAAKKVGYNNPLTQEIITNKYIRSHIDLLAEDASPSSPSPVQPVAESQSVLDVALAFTANEIQDGGQTPGPFEDMRRRMAGLGNGSPLTPAESGGIRKRKKKEKKRHWVWTIGKDEDGEEVGGTITALRAGALATASCKISASKITGGETAITRIENANSTSGALDVEMSDTSSLTSETPSLLLDSVEMDLDVKTPTAPQAPEDGTSRKRDTPIPELSEARDAPVAPQFV